MQMLGTLRLLLLAGTCLGVYGDPVRLLDINADQDSDCGGRCAGAETTVGPSRTDLRSELLDREHATGLMLNISAGGWPDPHGQPVGAASSGPSLPVDPEGEKEVMPVTGEPMLSSSAGRNKLDVAVSNAKFPPRGFLSPTPSAPIGMTVRQRKVKGDEHQIKRPGYGDSLQGKDPETRSPPSAEPPYTGVWIGKVTFSSSIPPSVSISPRISTPVPMWGRDGATTSALPDPLLPEIEPKLMPREDGPENLWTEAARPGGADTVVPLAQDDATEGTMSSEALPLIFEPFEDAAPEGPLAATPVPSSAQTPAATPLSEADLDQLGAVETDGDGPSNAPPLLVPEWTSPWQTSGGAVRTPNLKENSPSAGTPTPSFTRAKTTIKTSTHQLMHKSRSGSEEMESEEEPDEDDDDENSEESVEDESEEDLTEIPKASSTQPPYSLIPPPPVWVQRNQGLMRSWVELIREKAGYVSGMLAPVGIGITGALLIVGILYSIRMIHRKRRNNFKHQRRKVRQPEQPREPAIRRQDQAMLLADSSEDEF